MSVISFADLTYPEEKQVWLDLHEWMNKKEKKLKHI